MAAKIRFMVRAADLESELNVESRPFFAKLGDNDISWTITAQRTRIEERAVWTLSGTTVRRSIGFIAKCDFRSSTIRVYPAQVTMRIVNKQNSNESLERNFAKLFTPKRPCCGTRRFASWPKITDHERGFIEQGWIVLEVDIWPKSDGVISSIDDTSLELSVSCQTKEVAEPSIPKLLCVGSGNMAQRIIKCIVESRPDAAQRILVTAPSDRNFQAIIDAGCRACVMEDLDTIVNFGSELVLLCIKAQDYIRDAGDPDTELGRLMSVLDKKLKLSFMEGIYPREDELLMVHVAVDTAMKLDATSVIYTRPRSDCHEGKAKKVLELLGGPLLEISGGTLATDWFLQHWNGYISRNSIVE